jgi:hypothetical protein
LVAAASFSRTRPCAAASCARAGRRRGRIRLRVRELGAGAIDGDLVVAPVDFREHLARLDGLVFEHVHRRDRAPHLCRDLRNVSVDLRVVCRLAP